MTSLSARLFGKCKNWVSITEPDGPALRFLAVFFGILGLYDFLDLYWGGTASSYWLVIDAPQIVRQLGCLQVALAVLETLIVGVSVILLHRQKRGRWACGLFVCAISAVFVLRASEAWFYFGLNDFYFFALTSFLSLQLFVVGGEGRVLRWPRQVLLYQTAWIYLATGILKLNPHWLSGDHLWIRQQYIAEVLRWPRPEWLKHGIARLDVNRVLAIAGVTGELGLGVLLLFRAPRWLSVTLAVLMHGFAAIALNVWFFGAAMVAQVLFVTIP